MALPIKRIDSASMVVSVICLACGGGDDADQALQGVDWVLWSIETSDGTVRPAEGHPAMLTFTGEVADGVSGMQRLAGNGGCNRFFGGYSLDGANGLAISELGGTRMMCPDSVMAGEDALMTHLPRAIAYSISGMDLIIEIEGGQLRFGLAVQ